MWDRFLRACRREPVDATPVWFMRQAGRYMAEYRAIRAKYSLLEICRQPELAAEVTLQPLRAFGVDAAILFSDILLPIAPMGAAFEFAPDEGPKIFEPVRDEKAIQRLRLITPEEDLPQVLETVRLLRRELGGKTPLIGFAGAPFTLASYLIEGGRSSTYVFTKRMMYERPELWSALLGKLAEAVRRYLRSQLASGADAVQLFDSWVGALSPQDYQSFVEPHVRHILSDLETTGAPVIHFGTGTATLLELQQRAGGTVIGIDWRVPLDQARRRLGAGVAIQGNLDPVALFAPNALLEQRVLSVLEQAGPEPGHIFNLGHGILPDTPIGAVSYVVDLVHERTRR
ncbi:MAG TPA: uroporphyrinogen decarboxylase [Polyangiaceae bacterium]|jgi:uroporphyrinogen decarboxylase